MMKEALTSKFNLLSGFMAMQSITGEMPEIINSMKGVHTWKLRAGKLGDGAVDYEKKRVESGSPLLDQSHRDMLTTFLLCHLF